MPFFVIKKFFQRPYFDLWIRKNLWRYISSKAIVEPSKRNSFLEREKFLIFFFLRRQLIKTNSESELISHNFVKLDVSIIKVIR